MIMQNNETQLSELLKAVSDSTRRSLVTTLVQEGASRVTDLANHYEMSLNAVSKHIKILEHAGLVTRVTKGRSHWIQANLDQFGLIEEWFSVVKSIWDSRLDKLDELLTAENPDE